MRLFSMVVMVAVSMLMLVPEAFADKQSRRSRRQGGWVTMASDSSVGQCSQGQCSQGQCLDMGRIERVERSDLITAPSLTSPAAGGTQSTVAFTSSSDALHEVNAERAKRGMKPYVNDPLLNQAANACAKIRAASQIHGHLSSDFDQLPPGAHATAAGCGALEPSWGWGSCCTYDNYTYGGAAWVMGKDGRRYMHLFVR